MINLPKKISPCPIVEAIFEMRFVSSLPEDAIFGMLYGQFKDEYSQFEELPILQLPTTLRKHDPELRYAPHYRSRNNNFILQLNPRAFSISNVEEYEGWDIFSAKIHSTYNQVNNSGVINEIERIGLRYISILENVNIFENSNFVISLKENAIKRKTNITTEIPYEHGYCNLKATSDAEVQLGGQNGRKVTGSVIDIDSIVNVDDFKKDIQTTVKCAHEMEKELFFNMLSDEFLKTLNPEY